MADGGDAGLNDRYEHLIERAVEYIDQSGGAVLEDQLIAHVFGSATSAGLWRDLLGSILDGDCRVTRLADGRWSTASQVHSSEFPSEFVVLDVETTGLRPRYHRITEVAIISVSEADASLWSTLVNPERGIPKTVAQLTGIDDQLVAHAPQFRSIAPTVLELTGNLLIIGHNIQFDVSFVNSELKRSGQPRLLNQTLDTLPLADALVPGLRQLSLNAVASALGVPHKNGHRATPDAEVTLAVFRKLRELAAAQGARSLDDMLSIGASRLSNRGAVRKVGRGRSVLDRSHLDAIPHEPGVYIMRDALERVIYVGKAKDLRKRVSSYYSQPLGYTRNMDGLLESIDRIDVELTGTELGALVLESQLIRRYRPRFNTVQRNVEQYVYVRVDTTNPWPRVELTRDRRADDARYFGPFKSSRQARDAVRLINDALPLRTCRRSFKDARSLGKPCIELSLKRCLGPCVGQADLESYRGHVNTVLAFFEGDSTALLDLLHRRLEAAAIALNFERAAQLRDQISRLERISLQQSEIGEAERVGHAILVQAGVEVGQRSIWYLLRGQRWASLTIESETSEADLTSRLGPIRDRALRNERNVVAHHHSIDEMALIWRWLRRSTGYDGYIPWNDGQDAHAIATLILGATLVIHDDEDEEIGAASSDRAQMVEVLEG